MKFSVSKQDFQKGINSVAHVSYSKNQRTILECILIEASGEKLTLNAFDTVTAIETYVFAEISEDGVCAIPSKLLLEVVSKMPEGDLLIEKNDEAGITISSGYTTIKLQEMDERQFPRFPEIEGDSFDIEKRNLKRLIDKTVFSVYQTPDKPIFTGLLFEIDETFMNVVGIDGVRLAKMTSDKELTEKSRIVIPAKAVKEAARLMGEDSDEHIRIISGKKACFFISDECRIYTRLLDGEFMNYENIIPKSFKSRIRINTKMLESSINMVSVMSRDQMTNPVRLTVGFDSLDLMAQSEFGTANDSVPAKLDGETLSISLNAKYLLDVLRVIDDEEILIDLESSLKPLIIRPVNGEEFLYLIVPLNVRG